MTIIAWIEDFMINLYEEYMSLLGIMHKLVTILMDKVGVIEHTYISWHFQFVTHVRKIFMNLHFKNLVVFPIWD